MAKRFFNSPKRPDRLWGPPSLLFNGYRGSFPKGGGGCSGWGLNFTTHLHIFPRFRMTGAIPLLPYMPSWHGQEQLYLELYDNWLIGDYYTQTHGETITIDRCPNFLVTYIISLLSVIHTIYSIIQTNIQGLHVSTVYGHLQALLLNQSKSYLKYISCALGSHALTLRLMSKYKSGYGFPFFYIYIYIYIYILAHKTK